MAQRAWWTTLTVGLILMWAAFSAVLNLSGSLIGAAVAGLAVAGVGFVLLRQAGVIAGVERLIAQRWIWLILFLVVAVPALIWSGTPQTARFLSAVDSFLQSMRIPFGARVIYSVLIGFGIAAVIYTLLLFTRRPAAIDTLSTPAPAPPRWFIAGVVVLVIGYVVAGIPMIRYWWNAPVQDGQSYMQIARYWAEGIPAVRGYWAPMYSWLIALTIRAGVEPGIGAMIINMIVGLGIVGLTLYAGKLLKLTYVFRLLLTALVSVFLLTQVYDVSFGADLAGAFLTLCLFMLWASPTLRGKPLLLGVLLGLVGGIGYLTKAYLLPFFFVHLVLSGVLFYRGKWRSLLTVSVVSSVIALVIAVPWIAAISARYGHLTISNSSAGTMTYVAPDDVTVSTVCDVEFCPLPEGIMFPWEDPDLSRMPMWSMTSSLEHFIHQVNIINTNLWAWFSFVIAPLSWVLLLCAVGILYVWNAPQQRTFLAWLVLSILLFTSGYTITWGFELRYHLATILILIIAAVFILQKLAPRGAWIAAVLLSLSLIRFVGGTFMRPAFALVSGRTPDHQCQYDGLTALSPFVEGTVSGYNFPYSQNAAFITQHPFWDPPELEFIPAEVAQTVQATTLTQYILPSEQAAQLIEYGYIAVTDVNICGTDYTLLRVP